MTEPAVAGTTPEEAIAAARLLVRTARAGTLATMADPSGQPFASLVSLATDGDGALLLLTSRLAAHTGHLAADGRASILVAQGGKGDPLAHPRLTLVGRATRADDADRPRIRRRFLARHPKAALYVDFADFGFWRFVPETGHWNGGFARAGVLPGATLLTDLSGADALMAAEEGALDHLNADHADALALYATRLAGAAPGRWRAIGLDPDGLDLAAGGAMARLDFGRRIEGPGDLRAVLVSLAARARAAGEPLPSS